ncbi:MAG: adenylosuccinate lyase, partial [Candidatus Lokiarchaeota archaeon]|nr:adenylosuccinate lyase [Candidatus Lokiarchaeota archaeon]MBD3341805.1 adenylosuccinate lyase [Candidatus Lokiarchaeota archaeon]
YRTEIADLFTEEKKLRNWMRVEATLAKVHADLENIPKEAAEEIDKARKKVKIERVKEIDREIHHDLMAMVKGLAEQCKGDAGKYIHLGATSYDIEDTAIALQLRDALIFIEASLKKLLKIILRLMEEKKDLVCIGRTHGQHAIPTTYGMRFGVWAYEIDRHLERILNAIKRISYGKMSGAVGTMASFGDQGIKIQEKVMKKLDLNPVLIANQIVQRDRHAEIILLTSMIGQTLAKIARTQRTLQRNEIGEMFEPFKKKQVGSSTMPHKRNPHKSERICSLARVLKSNAIIALDNMVLEDERDLTNSASERVLFAENFIFLDFMISELTKNLQGVEFDEKKIEENLNLTKGACLAEKIMVELVNRGIGRQEGHEILRQAAIKARKKDQFMKDILIENKEIKNKFTKEELDEILDPHKYIGKAIEQVENLIKVLKKKYRF